MSTDLTTLSDTAFVEQSEQWIADSMYGSAHSLARARLTEALRRLATATGRACLYREALEKLWQRAPFDSFDRDDIHAALAAVDAQVAQVAASCVPVREQQLREALQSFVDEENTWFHWRPTRDARFAHARALLADPAPPLLTPEEDQALDRARTSIAQHEHYPADLRDVQIVVRALARLTGKEAT